MFERLLIAQLQTAWVMCQIGRACFEMVNFSEAAEAFTRARQLDPCRLEVTALPDCGHSFYLSFNRKRIGTSSIPEPQDTVHWGLDLFAETTYLLLAQLPWSRCCCFHMITLTNGFRRNLVYLQYWTLNLRPLMV